MMWSDRTIKEAHDKGRINITPFNEENLQPNSIDLTLDDDILVWSPIRNKYMEYKLVDGFEILPNMFVLASTKEHVTLNNGVCAQVDGKSTYGRKGLQIHQTAGFIDAGFSGNITLEIQTVAEPIMLKPDMLICQLIFYDAYPSNHLYGDPALNSHYQGQTGVTKSAI